MNIGKLIYLNGASSSGKSLIAKDLQSIFEETYLHISSDIFASFYPSKKAPLKTYSKDYLSSVRKSLNSEKKPSTVKLYNSMVFNIINEGMNVIADTTFLKYMTIAEIQQLASVDAYLIDVKCKLEVLEKRELLRKDRPIGAAKVHHKFCYGYVRNDCEVDTSTTDSMTCAQQIKNCIGNHVPKAFAKIIEDYKDQPNFSLFENWNINQ